MQNAGSKPSEPPPPPTAAAASTGDPEKDKRRKNLRKVRGWPLCRLFGLCLRGLDSPMIRSLAWHAKVMFDAQQCQHVFFKFIANITSNFEK